MKNKVKLATVLKGNPKNPFIQNIFEEIPGA